jgi:hypothetical protein
MICDIVSAKEIFERSLKRAKKLRETMSITKEGEFLDNTIRIAKKSLSLLNERDFAGLNEHAKAEFNSDVATVVAMEQLGGRFQASVRKTPTGKSEKETFILKAVKHRHSPNHGDILELTVTNEKTGKHGKYSFLNGGSISKVTAASNNRMYIPEFDMVSRKVVNTINGVDAALTRPAKAKAANKGIKKLREAITNAKNFDELMGSAAEFSEADFKYKRTSKQTNYTHGDVEHMRNMLADLHAIGGRPTTDAMYEQYDALLNKMHPKFFRDMTLYLNENEEHSAGWVNLDKERILINASSNTDSGMSNAEVYMHETIHTMTAWALRSGTPRAIHLKERLHFLKEKAAKAITWQTLMKADKTLSEKGARERYDYIFNSEHSDDEFIAFALTNEAFSGLLSRIKIKEKESKNIFESIKQFFADMLNAVMGNYDFSKRDSDLAAELNSLSFALAEINVKANKDLTTNASMFSKLGQFVDTFELVFEEFVSGVGNKVFDTKNGVVAPRDMSSVQKALYIAKVYLKAIYNPDYRNQVGRHLTILSEKSKEMKHMPNIHLDARSSFREIARSVLPSVHGHITTTAEFLGLKTNTIDLTRNSHVSNTLNSIIDNFDRTLVDQEQEAVTSVILEANASTLFKKDKNGGKGYTPKQITKLLLDKHTREVTIARVKSRIKKHNAKRANWVTGQAEGLGILMATGKGHKAQNTNSDNIVRGYLTSERFPEDKHFRSLVEELASLTALNHQKATTNAIVANLINTEEKGIKNVVNIYEAFKLGSEKALFKGDASHITEGYVRELFDEDIETRYEVISKRKELEEMGFKLVSEYESNDVSGAEAVGFFVSDTYTRPEKLSGSVSLGNPGSRGTTLKAARYAQFHDSPKHAQVWFEADKIKHDAAAIEINKQLEAGVDVRTIEQGPVPVLDASGNAVDYRNMMSKADKARYLKQNKKVNDVLSKTAGSVIDKVAREQQNEEVLAHIKKQVAEIYDNESSKDNELEFTLVSPTSDNPQLRKLYFQLPKSFQRFAASRADKALPIPTMLMDQYFGYEHFRFSDLPGIKHLPNAVKRILNMFEKVFMDIVKIAKGNILLKMPAVLIVNIISNILYAVSTGTNPLELVSAYVNSTRDVHNFMQKHRKHGTKTVELQALTQEYHTRQFSSESEKDAYNDEVRRLKGEIKRLEKYMKDSPIKELFDLGMYQAVIEDVNMYKLGDTNIVADKLDRLTEKLPTVVKKGTQWLYLSKETEWYKTNQYILQMSDLVARDVMNRKQKMIEQRQVDGDRELPAEFRKLIGLEGTKKKKLTDAEKETFLAMAKKSRHAALLKAFVNYNLPNGKGEEYLNRIGVLMFTKYIKRIQSVIADVSTKHPIRGTATLLAAGFALDLEMIQDSSFFVKAGDDYGLFGLTSVHNPVDVLMTVVNPPLINLGEELPGFAY